MRQIKIKTNLNIILGPGGFNYEGLASFGWERGAWLNVVEENSNGVRVTLPKAKSPVLIYKHEIEEFRIVEDNS